MPKVSQRSDGIGAKMLLESLGRIVGKVFCAAMSAEPVVV